MVTPPALGPPTPETPTHLVPADPATAPPQAVRGARANPHSSGRPAPVAPVSGAGTPQPHYPFEFHQADALDILRALSERGSFYPSWLGRVDAVHCSPTCQTFARVTAWRGSRDSHPDMLTPTLSALAGIRIPWVVENVPEAGLRADYRLCGTQFGLNVRRHRDFQCGNWAAYELMPPCQCYRNPALLPFEHKAERAYADAMGCTWMSSVEARQAIPPAYTEHIGRALIGHLAATEAA
jgi:hypothetical protein